MKLVEIMTTSIRAKVSPALSKIKMWMKPSYVKNKALAKVRTFFQKLFDVRPKDENDYYAIGGWLFSKKLALAFAVFTIVFCGCYIWMSMPAAGSNHAGYKAYKYNSIVLKFISDKVEILGKSGYTAYVGDVKNGVVSGTGTLYDIAGNVVYTGEFDANSYNGTGKLYDKNKTLKYEGEFSNNLYDGEGKEYRSNGSLLYTGAYQAGRKEGAGQLYDASGNLIYSGRFHQDEIYYPELLGKTTAEIAEMYTGGRSVYEGGSDYCVYMEDISAVYGGIDASNSLSEEWTVSKVYVLKSEICLDGTRMETISDIEKVLGEPVYEGNTNLTLSDEIALNLAITERETSVLFGPASLAMNEIYADVHQIENYEKDYIVYLYVFEKDDMIYQFFCQDSGNGFGYYSIEQ